MDQIRLIPGWYKGALAVVAFSMLVAFGPESSASTRLKTLSSCSLDFRTNDRDWGHVNDFWTFNVTGLYSLTSIQEPGFFGKLAIGASRSVDHLLNPRCQHSIKDWTQGDCPRIFWTTID